MSWFPSYEKIKENAPMIIGGIIIGWTIRCITSIDHNVHTINTKLDTINDTIQTKTLSIEFDLNGTTFTSNK